MKGRRKAKAFRGFFICATCWKRSRKKGNKRYKRSKGKKRAKKVLTKGDRCGRINKLSPREGRCAGGSQRRKKDQKRFKKIEKRYWQTEKFVVYWMSCRWEAITELKKTAKKIKKRYWQIRRFVVYLISCQWGSERLYIEKQIVRDSCQRDLLIIDIQKKSFLWQRFG